MNIVILCRPAELSVSEARVGIEMVAGSYDQQRERMGSAVKGFRGLRFGLEMRRTAA